MHKNQVIVAKTGIWLKNYWKTAKWLTLMTSYVKNGIWYENIFFQNVCQILVNNFNHDRNFWKQCYRAQKVVFFCISYINHPYVGRFTKIWLTTASASLNISKPRFFWTSKPNCWLLDKSQLSPPPSRLFFEQRRDFWVLVNVTETVW